MSHARAAIAGGLAVILSVVILTARSDDLGAELVILAGLLIILIVPEAPALYRAWRGRNGRDDPGPGPDPDGP